MFFCNDFNLHLYFKRNDFMQSQIRKRKLELIAIRESHQREKTTTTSDYRTEEALTEKCQSHTVAFF